ncbi:MAG: DUF2950 family protein [Paracoccaceae bacterium]
MSMFNKMTPVALAFTLGLGFATVVAAQDATRFQTPDAAVDAVIAALHDRSLEDLLAVFGEGSEDILLSGEAPRDRAAWTEFLNMYDQSYFIHTNYGDTATLFLGDENWAFPAPLILGEDGLWAFDIEEARTEVLIRRIGRNELEVIEIMQGYVAAQAEFRQLDRDGDGVLEFASSILSSPDTHDGLYWSDGESPLGDFIAKAAADGYSMNGEDFDPQPYAGYYYRLLTSQGDDAPGGAMEYVINGHQVAGHGLLAVPAAYGETGVMSFMISENGIVMEADLGEDSLQAVLGMFSYNPGEGWAAIN